MATSTTAESEIKKWRDSKHWWDGGGKWTCCWSRYIDEKNRIVYRVLDYGKLVAPDATMTNGSCPRDGAI